MKVLKYKITNNTLGDVDSLAINATLKTSTNSIFDVRAKEIEAPEIYRQLLQAISSKNNDFEFSKITLISEKENLKQKPKFYSREGPYRDRKIPINYDVNPEKIIKKVIETTGPKSEYRELKSDINVGKPELGRKRLSEVDFISETSGEKTYKEEFVAVDGGEDSEDGLIPDEGDDEDESF